MPNVIIPAGQAQQLDIAFGIAVKQEQVTVQSENTTVDVNPANNASATILKGEDLEALSDDPDELEQDLLALAGPSVGPNGGQIYIDGFSNGTLPPKSAIREVRINQNPFSAEYDRPGFGRVEVFTKPGSNKWHGQVMFNENNSVFNSRNPYVLSSVPPYHSELYSGNVSGALTKQAFGLLQCRAPQHQQTCSHQRHRTRSRWQSHSVHRGRAHPGQSHQHQPAPGLAAYAQQHPDRALPVAGE